MSMISTLTIIALGILASSLAPGPAGAAPASASFGVTATVQASCRTTANAIAFRTYAAAAVNTASLVSVTCSNSVPYNVSLNAETGLVDPVAIRETTASSAALPAYAVGTHPHSILNRGQAPGTALVTRIATRSDQVIAGHKQISGGQYLAAGAYFDSIIVTVSY